MPFEPHEEPVRDVTSTTKLATRIQNRFGIVNELFRFLWERKLWWMIPMVSVLVLLGGLIALAGTSGIGPFIYTFF